MTTIAEVSQKFDISADTLRYYERIGLIPPVNRNKNGVRDYTDEDCRWVEFIKCMRSAGLQIEALIEYVSLYQQGDDTSEARLDILVEQRRQLAERIDIMQKTLERLDQKIRVYDKIKLPDANVSGACGEGRPGGFGEEAEQNAEEEGAFEFAQRLAGRFPDGQDADVKADQENGLSDHDARVTDPSAHAVTSMQSPSVQRTPVTSARTAP